MPSVRPDRINRPLRVVLRAPPSGHGATGGQAPRRVSAGDRRGDARRTPAGIRAEPQPDDEVTMNAFVKYLLTRGRAPARARTIRQPLARCLRCGIRAVWRSRTRPSPLRAAAW